jgi:hypothetical protein
MRSSSEFSAHRAPEGSGEKGPARSNALSTSVRKTRRSKYALYSIEEHMENAWSVDDVVIARLPRDCIVSGQAVSFERRGSFLRVRDVVE